MDRRKFIAFSAATAAMTAAGPSLARSTVQVEQKRVSINGADLAFSLAGPEDATPMVVLHGGRGYGTHDGVFNTYLPLADKFRLIGFDMRGHGKSADVGPFTFAQMVSDIEAIRSSLGGGRKMILLGGSFGGMVALSYAVRHQENLSNLILRGTAPSWEHEAGALANFQARTNLAPMATKGMLEKVFTPTISSDEEFRLIMFALAPMYAEGPASVDMDRLLARTSKTRYNAKVHNDLFADHSYDVVDRLSEIRTRTLVFCGAQDWICPPDQSKLIADRIAGAQLKIVPDSNHGVPDATALGIVKDFLFQSA